MEEVDAIDRFYSKRDHEAQRKIYTALCIEEGIKNQFMGAPDEITLKGLGYYPGVSAEVFFASRKTYYDAILSRAVLEHLFDPIGALHDMASSLKPGGSLIHRIDLRDHGMFSEHHPLTHLTINEFLYHRMTRKSGRPNRVLIHQYRQWLDESDLKGEVLITRLAGIKNEITPARWTEIPAKTRKKAIAIVQQVRPKLTRTLRNVSDQDLAVTGIVLNAKASG